MISAQIKLSQKLLHQKKINRPLELDLKKSPNASSNQSKCCNNIVTKSQHSSQIEPKMGTELVDELRYLKLNISGKHFRCLRHDFIRYLDTRLGKLAAACNWQDASAYCDLYIDETQEFYFNRSQLFFDSILDFYRYEIIHLPNNGCPDRFIAEMDFWQIERKYIASCCQPLIPERLLNCANIDIGELPKLDTENVYNRFDANSIDSINELNVDHANNNSKWYYSTKRALWNFLENPHSSAPATVFGVVSIVFVLATVAILVLDSLPDFQQFNPDTNVTDVIPALNIADGTCVGWFTFEYLMRLYASPATCQFIRLPMSVIDLLAILPFYIEMILTSTKINAKIFRSLLVLRLMRLLRVLRVIRILKVARYSSGFRAVGRALYRSYRELILLVMFMITMCLMFSTLMYFFEREEHGAKIRTIPDAAWWCIITMTTVGYGDTYPISIAGKFLAAVVCISGVVILAFPISIIVENFNIEYVERKNSMAAAQLAGSGSPLPARHLFAVRRTSLARRQSLAAAHRVPSNASTRSCTPQSKRKQSLVNV